MHVVDNRLCLHHAQCEISSCLSSKCWFRPTTNQWLNYCDVISAFLLNRIVHREIDVIDACSISEPCRGKTRLWLLTRSYSNLPAQLQKKARNLKFQIFKRRSRVVPSVKQKKKALVRCAVSYCTADLCLCFGIVYVKSKFSHDWAHLIWQ